MCTHAAASAVDRDCICVGGRGTLRSIYLRSLRLLAIFRSSREEACARARARALRPTTMTHSRVIRDEREYREYYCYRLESSLSRLLPNRNEGKTTRANFGTSRTVRLVLAALSASAMRSRESRRAIAVVLFVGWSFTGAERYRGREVRPDV